MAEKLQSDVLTHGESAVDMSDNWEFILGLEGNLNWLLFSVVGLMLCGRAFVALNIKNKTCFILPAV